MLTVVVTLHPRAQQAIHDMWRLADLPDFSPDRVENQSRIVILDAIEDIDRAKALLRPYMEEARSDSFPQEKEFHPFTSDAIEVLFARSDGKPRDLLRKAFALIEQGSTKNWDYIDGRHAAEVLDSLTIPDEEVVRTIVSSAPMEELWTE